MDHTKPALLPSMLQMKCPKCRRGRMFVNKSVFPLGKMLDMPDRCPVCGQKMELEVGFYYGTGYVSYALSVALFFFNLIWYWSIFGLSYKDNSIFYYLITSVTIVIVLQPWLMRFSRVLYLYMFVKYGTGTAFKSEE
ncbi:MAG: hypothetical protein K0R82_1897 [Flavipsychrobacter sp.]|jgi:hypothetical protein|nr:hypothetical protein [Flavipsychrobacter sp.]